MKIRTLLTLAVVVVASLVAAPATAQLAAPNASGAAIGHIHINASDVEVQTRFWTAVGGKIVQREKITMVQFPGIYVRSGNRTTRVALSALPSITLVSTSRTSMAPWPGGRLPG